MARPAMMRSCPRNTLVVLWSVLVLVAAVQSRAEPPVTDLTVRERFEIWNGYNKKAYGADSINAKGKQQGQAYDNILIQRVIAGISGKNGGLSWRLALYDARAWGTSLGNDDFIKNRGTDQEHVMNPYEEFVEPYELSIKTPGFGTNHSLTIGRQVIGYGDKRIFGPGETTNSVGWLWDAVRYSARFQEGFVDFWYGQTKVQNPHTLDLFTRHAYQGAGLYGQHPLPGQGMIQPFAAWKQGLFFNNDLKESTYWFGARLVRDSEPGLVYDITLARETGQFLGRNRPGQGVDAAGYAIKLGWFFKQAPLAPKIMIGQVYASGDSDPDDTSNTTFTRPFGTTDGGHYGIMDLMSWSNERDNLVDVRITPWPGSRLRFVFHDFHLDQRADKWAYFGYRVPNNRYDRIGREYDLILTANPMTWLKVMAFYGHFTAGDFVEKNHIARNNADRMVLQLCFQW